MLPWEEVLEPEKKIKYVKKLNSLDIQPCFPGTLKNRLCLKIKLSQMSQKKGILIKISFFQKATKDGINTKQQQARKSGMKKGLQ